MTVRKEVDKPLKYKGKSYKVRELIKKTNIKGDVDIIRRKSWFEDAMTELDNKKEQ